MLVRLLDLLRLSDIVVVVVAAVVVLLLWLYMPFGPAALSFTAPAADPLFFTTHNNYNDYYFISMQMI